MAAFLGALATGSAEVSIGESIDALRGAAPDHVRSLVMDLRLPRAMTAFAVGGLLAVAGVLMQVLLRNPLAEPYILGSSGGAAVAALDEKNRICLLRQYRHAADGWLWELPAGKIDKREPPLETAQRELADEAGVAASDWTPLGQMLPSPGVFCEVIYLWLARGLSAVTQAPEEDELLEVHWVDFEEAWAMALDGRIRDGKTLAGLLRARTYLYDQHDTDSQE